MQSKKIIQHISNWLKIYSQKSQTNGFIIGLSGGIDSALTSTLCAKTGLPTLCVQMPIHQNKNQVNRATNHIKWLQEQYSRVEKTEINLTKTFNCLRDILPKKNSEDTQQLALANTRARLRMTTLYYMASIRNALVAGTGNKIEDFGIGFYTKYGDGGVDLSPIANLTKTEVYILSQNLGISEDILSAAPTDGLWGDNRTDEQQIGASYPELEWAMEISNSENNVTNLNKRQHKVLDTYNQLHKTNQHKMKPIPVCSIPKEFYN